MASLEFIVLCALVFLRLIPCCQCRLDENAAFIIDDLSRHNISLCEFSFCSSNVSDLARDCYCDQQCVRYGDCCLDSKQFARQPFAMPRHAPVCNSLNGLNIYTVSKCPSSYIGEEVRHYCEDYSGHLSIAYHESFLSFDLDDEAVKNPYLFIPVTSVKSRLTYSNIYCSACNGEKKNDSHFWYEVFQCSNEKHEVFASVNASSVVRSSNRTSLSCDIHSSIPPAVAKYVRSCRRTIDSCNEQRPSDDFIDLCSTYTAKVYDDKGLAYRNPHCALCRGAKLEPTFLCSIGKERFSTEGIGYFSIRFLLDFSGSGEVGSENQCRSSQIWNAIGGWCMDLFCGPNSTLVNRRCQPMINTTLADSSTTIEPEKNCSSCAKVILSEGSFVFSNGTLTFPLFEGLVVDICENPFVNGSETRSSDNHTGAKVVICAPDLEISAKFNTALGYLTVICLFVSIISLCLHLSVFCAKSELPNLSERNLASLSVCLLTANIGFLLSSAVSSHPFYCRILSVINYSAFLASFCWMNVMAIDVFFTIRYATRELRVSSGRQRGRYLLYCSYVLSVTLLLVTLTLLADGGLLPSASGNVAPGFGAQFGVCWMKNKQALKYFFAVPLFIILSINVLLFVLTTRIIRHTRSATASHTCSASLMSFRLCWRLSLMMGLSWVINLLNGWLDKQYLHYVGAILTALQGLFIFVSFTLNDKVRVKLSSRLRIYSRLLSWSRDSADQQRQRASTTVTSLTTSHSAPPTAEKSSHSAQSAGAHGHQSRAIDTEALNISAVTPL